MSFLLISGIVMVVVPLVLMVGFAGFIFFMFMKDDPDSFAIVQVALIVMVFGFCLIVADYGMNQLN
jgi:hypothetical protein